jgi:hypothetical protein
MTGRPQSSSVALPRRPRGRPNGSAEAAYQASLEEFCDRILKIKSQLDFEVGTRGWCYLLEGERVIDKGEFDACENLITRCCKDGNLPLDICAEDGKRAADGIERLDGTDVEDEADAVIDYIDSAHLSYTPFSFWADLDVYMENLADHKHPDYLKLHVQDYLRRFGARKLEAKALVARPEAGRELCRQAILRYVPETAISDYRQRLAAVRQKLQHAIIARMAAE